MNSNLKCWFQTPVMSNAQSCALLLLRLIVGIAFLYHGSGKIQSPFGWMPGGQIPGFLQALSALAEFGGGLALILGLLTPLAMLGLAINMAVATSMHALVFGDPFVNMTGGRSFEPALGYFGIAVMFILIGPGKFSLDYKIFGPRTK
jgi:putative oxidoreductase